MLQRLQKKRKGDKLTDRREAHEMMSGGGTGFSAVPGEKQHIVRVLLPSPSAKSGGDVVVVVGVAKGRDVI